MSLTDFRKSRIPQHRSVRTAPFEAWRLVVWGGFSVAFSLVASRHVLTWTGWYAHLVELALRWAGVPFAAFHERGVWLVSTPGWSVATFNPVATGLGALAYGGGAAALLLGAVMGRRIPFPLRAWMGLGGGLLLLTTVVLFLLPIPRLTPERFSQLWSQVALGTTLVSPWAWALLVGLLPIPLGRVVLWGFIGVFTLFLWSALRLAFCLALAHWAGSVWLPPAFILGCSLPDILVVVTAYGFALEPAGGLWERGQ